MTAEMRGNLYIILRLPTAFLLSASTALIIASCLHTANLEADLYGALTTGAKTGAVFFSANLAFLTYKSRKEVVFPGRRGDDLLVALHQEDTNQADVDRPYLR